jgi:hypothetical protein
VRRASYLCSPSFEADDVLRFEGSIISSKTLSSSARVLKLIVMYGLVEEDLI